MVSSACNHHEELLGEVANLFFAELAKGKSPSIHEYAQRYPELAEEIQRVFPALLMVSDSIVATTDVLPAAAGCEREQLGDFRLIREIGRGGMGVVYEAEQLSLGRRVALKVLPFAAMLNKQQLNRFKVEARAAGTLDHPHVVSIYSVGSERSVHFYAMQLIDGRSLAEVIKHLRLTVGKGKHRRILSDPPGSSSSATHQTRPMPGGSTFTSSSAARFYREVAELGTQAADALSHAHANGVLHRDIKPGNLLIDDEGKAWITDFGLARVQTAPDMTMTGDLLGTLRYMSPEQALGKKTEVGEGSDVYSLGATLYELATLRPLFADDNRESLLHAIANREPRSPRSIRPDMPRDLETIILKAIAKDTRQRYPSARAMADDLQRFQRKELILARRPSYLDRLASWARRHHRLALASMVTITLIASVLAASTFLVNRARTRTNLALRKSEEDAARLAELLYTTDLQLAYQAWEKGWPDEARSILDRYRASAEQIVEHGFERHLLDRLVREPQSFVLSGSAAGINEVATFPDGKRLATVGDDGTVRVWDTHSKRLMDAYCISDSGLHAVAVSPDGQSLAAAGAAVHLIDLDTGSVQRLLERDVTIESLAFSADGKVLAAGSRYAQVDLITLSDGSIRSIESGARHESLRFGRDHLLFMPYRGSGDAEVESGVVRLVDVTTEEVVQTFRNAMADFASGNFSCVCTSADHDYAVVGDRYRARFAVFRTSTGKCVAKTSSARSRLNSLAMEPDGTSIAAAYENGNVLVWNVQYDDAGDAFIDPQPLVLEAHRGEATSVQYLDRHRLVTVGEDGLARVWDLNTISRPADYSLDGMSGYGVQFSPQGDQLALSTIDKIRIVDSDSGAVRYTSASLKTGCTQLQWSPDGSRLAGCLQHQGRVLIHYAPDWSRVDALQHGPHLEEMAFSSDGRRLATIGWHELHVWDVETGERLRSVQLPEYGWTVDYAHQKKWLAYAGRFGRIVIYDVNHERAHAEIPCLSDTLCVVFSPDDRWIATGHLDARIRVWNAVSGDLYAEFSGHARNVERVAFHPGGRILASAGSDGSLRLWNVAAKCAIGVLYQRNFTSDVSFSPDGRRIAGAFSAFDKGPAVRVWTVGRLE